MAYRRAGNAFKTIYQHVNAMFRTAVALCNGVGLCADTGSKNRETSCIDKAVNMYLNEEVHFAASIGKDLQCGVQVCHRSDSWRLCHASRPANGLERVRELELRYTFRRMLCLMRSAIFG
jgi:hypothetical protein